MNSTAKTMAVLERLLESQAAAPLAEIARVSAMPKPTVHRILKTLVDVGYVRTNGDGSYAAGPRLLALSGRVLLHVDRRAIVRPVLDWLQERTGQTVHFASFAGDTAVYVDKLEAAQPYQMASRVGMEIALHCTAIGKAILAELPADIRDRLIGSMPLPGRTDKTRTTRRALLPELDGVRGNGYAIDDEENERNVRCVGAAVMDSSGHVVGAVSVSGLTFQLTLQRAREIGPTVREAAAEISTALGHAQALGAAGDTQGG